MTIKIKWGEKEIENPILRAVAVPFVLVVGGIAMFGAIVALMILVPISIPLHALLRLCGRRGFIEKTDSGGTAYNVSSDGFRAKIT